MMERQKGSEYYFFIERKKNEWGNFHLLLRFLNVTFRKQSLFINLRVIGGLIITFRR